MRIAALVDYYLPGYKAGGALRTVANMAAQLSDEFDFAVITRDRDHGDADPYPEAVPGGWTDVQDARVRYLAPRECSPVAMRAALRESAADVLYLNSVFSPLFTLQPILLTHLRQVPRIPVVVAPRGELSPGALKHKRAKKVGFLRAARAAGLYRGVLWQASSDLEADEVRTWFGPGARVQVAPDLREAPAPRPPSAPKRPGELRAVFLSRIAPKKNLGAALETLEGLEGEVSFTIYGPVDDEAYWRECRSRIERLSPGVRVEYGGVLRHDRVPEALGRAHLFLFPTLGENFGHVILEALLAGLPVLTSDRTPWRDLEAVGAGWALPLEEPERFRDVLRMCVDSPAAEHERRSAAARAYGEAAAVDPRVDEANRALFRCAAGANGDATLMIQERR